MLPWVRSPRPRSSFAASAISLLMFPGAGRGPGPQSNGSAAWTPAFAGAQLSQPLQRSTEPFGLRRLGLMVRPRFLDRLGLGALGEVRIGEPLGEAVALLFGGGGGLVESDFLGFEVDDTFERQTRNVAPSTTNCAALVARPNVSIS